MSPRRPRTHVVARIGDRDTYAPRVEAFDSELPLAFQAANAPATARISDGVWSALDEKGLSPTLPAIDFYRLASAVYSADARVLRAAGFDRWTRDLVLHLPVSDVALWQGVEPVVVSLLQFLTGDRWEVRFRSGMVSRPPVDVRRTAGAVKPLVRVVSLLSGGMDSFIGALDRAAVGDGLLLVSHNAVGSARFSSPAQDAVVESVRRVTKAVVAHMKMTVSPPEKAVGAKAETTQRSRSIIFVALGVLVASAYAPGLPLLVAENGFISLNVPMTAGRLGSLSTRTTHPHTIALLRELLRGLGIGVSIETPCHFQTKGEMLVGCLSRDQLAATIHATSSCARPNDRKAAASRPQSHCGYCVPCIIRRAAMSRAGYDDASKYRYDVLTERGVLMSSPDRRKDLFAVEIALARASIRANITDVLRAGPLPDEPADVGRYVDVYRNGLEEVGLFLNGRSPFSDGTL